MTWSPAVRADPIIKILDAAQWSSAISGGYVQGLSLNTSDPRYTQNTDTLNKIYTGQTTAFRDSSVSTDTSTVDGLVTSYGSSADTNTSTIGCWSYIGPDPDYSASSFSLNLYLPQVGLGAGFDTAAFALVDNMGRAKAWAWDSTVLTTGASQFDFKFKDGLGAGGSTFFYEDIGFDLTHVAMLQGSFRGTLTPSFPHIDGSSTGLQAGTASLQVVPEGDSAILFGAGMLGLLLVGRRKRAVSR